MALSAPLKHQCTVLVHSVLRLAIGSRTILLVPNKRKRSFVSATGANEEQLSPYEGSLRFAGASHHWVLLRPSGNAGAGGPGSYDVRLALQLHQPSDDAEPSTAVFGAIETEIAIATSCKSHSMSTRTIGTSRAFSVRSTARWT